MRLAATLATILRKAVGGASSRRASIRCVRSRQSPTPPASRYDNHAGERPAAAINHNALRSACASMIVYAFVNHVNQEVVIHGGICQGSGGAPGGAATPEAKEEHGQVRQRSLHDRSAPLSSRQSLVHSSHRHNSSDRWTCCEQDADTTSHETPQTFDINHEAHPSSNVWSFEFKVDFNLDKSLEAMVLASHHDTHPTTNGLDAAAADQALVRPSLPGFAASYPPPANAHHRQRPSVRPVF
eukprot:COSAG04_NODE_534_length_12949_cov_5.651673_10_plen_241_part_00